MSDAAPPDRPSAGSQDPAVRGAVLFSLPGALAARERWDDLLSLARSQRFLQAQADEMARARSSESRPDPLATIDIALEHAIRLNRVPDVAVLMLSRARWTRRLAARTPLAALRAGRPERARELADADQRAVLWYLLLAWELHASGNPGAAQQMLRDLLRKRAPLLSGRDSTWAVILMRHAVSIDEHTFGDLLNLLDDNDLTDLGRRLIEAGDLMRARLVAMAIRTFVANRVSLLAEIAVKQAQAESSEAAQATVALARDALRQTDPDDRQIKWLALIACALALSGDQAAAETALRDAHAAAGRLTSPSAGLVAIAAAQVQAGLLESAERTTAQIQDDNQRLEALESLAAGQAQAGEAELALRTLSGISSWYDHYNRGVRAVAIFLAAANPPLALHLVQDMLEPGQQDGALAAVAAAAARAGQAPLAAQIAHLIEDHRWRARALVDIAAAEPAGRSAAGEPALAAIEAVADDKLRALLLAEFSATRPPPEGARLQARAVQVARDAPADDRWEILASIAAIQGETGAPGAPDTFVAARQAVLASYDPWYSERELSEIARLQDEVGDSTGARDTIAAALEGPQRDEAQPLVPLSLAGIAAAQAKAGDVGAARQTIEMAIAKTAGLSGELRALTCRVIAEALAVTGDFDMACKMAFSLIGPIGPDNEDAEDVEGEDEEGEDGEEAVESVRQVITAGAAIASALTDAGDQHRAAQVLGQIADRLAGELAAESLSYRDAIVELAEARAAAGDFAGALDTAACDETSQAADAALAAIAKAQLLSGDLAAARATVPKIRRLRSRIPALADVATVLASHGKHASAEGILAEAALEADPERASGRARYPVEDSAGALISIARAQLAIGLPEAARRSLTRAHDLVSSIPAPADQARELSQIAQAQSALGDIESALTTAQEIQHPWYSGEALLPVAMRAARLGSNLAATMKVIDAIKDPWWHAAGLVAVAAPAHARGDDKVAGYFAEAQKLINQIAEGEHRTRLREAIAEIFISNGCYAEAIDTVRAMSTDASSHLVQLADALLAKGAVEAIKTLLPDCAHHLAAAYMVCRTLARAYPNDARAVAREVQRSSAL